MRSIGFTAERPSQKTRYVGVADWWGRHVWVEDDRARRLLQNHGAEPLPSFALGRSGAGARELALAIRWDATGSKALTERFCGELTHQLIVELPQDGFQLNRAEILRWLAAKTQRAP